MSVALDWLLPMPAGGRDRFQAAVQSLTAKAQSDAVAAQLWAAGAADVSLTEAQALRRSYISWRKAVAAVPSGFREVRLTLVADETLSFVADALFACGLRHGLLIGAHSERFDECVAAARQGDFERAESEDFAVILPPASRLNGSDEVTHTLADVAFLAGAMKREAGTTPVLATLPARLGEPKNSSDLVIDDSPRALRARLNAGLLAEARAGNGVVWDLEGLSGRVGAGLWHDPRLMHHAKIPFSLAVTMRVADDLASVIAGATGRSRRVLVLDLDNTLWGGVIGDDGLSGIVLGQGSAVGEAFLDVQRVALELRRRGIALAVCSKNDEANAREPFRAHPDMLLKEEHIAVFAANWQDKATNIRSIAGELNLGLQSVAFLDDNPAERERVRQVLPEVAVIEVGDDPAQYATRLLNSGFFEHLPLSAEDRARAADYQANAGRSALLARAESYEDYLASLGMEMRISRFDSVGRARIAQLVNRSNQFNLTTRRMNEDDVAVIEASAQHMGFQVRLKDRFADNGMISVVVIEMAGRDWLINTWLMSCRVLKRGVEQAVLNALAELARREGALALIGIYLPTAKNAMVENHYASLGFAPLGEIAGGPATDDGRRATRWRLELAGYVASPVQMSVKTEG